MIARVIRVLVPALLALASAGCSHLAALQNPQPIAAQAPDPMVVRQAILSALPRRHWVAEGEWPGVIVARLDIRSHQVRVRIDYDAETVRIAYVDSQNLDFTTDAAGVPYIHRNYNVWARNLASDISAALSVTPPVVIAY